MVYDIHVRLGEVPSDQYFDEDPNVASAPTIVDVTLPDIAFTMETDRGVFSHGHLDTATSMLLRADLALASTGNLLDLGCGSGAIALTMALRSPDAIVWALDVNGRARELCRPQCRAQRDRQHAWWRIPTRSPPTSVSQRSGRTRRSASARTNCMISSSRGSADSNHLAMQRSWSKSTSEPTRCSDGWSSAVTSVFEPDRRPASGSSTCDRRRIRP